VYEELEGFARAKIRKHLQDLLEEEVTEWLGRAKGERKQMFRSSQNTVTGRRGGSQLRSIRL
jgi:transposase-like protein